MAAVVVGEARNGQGLFANRAFKINQRILKIVGRITHHSIVWKRGGTFADNCFRFGPETYLNPGEHVSRYLNHSCDPNAGIIKRNNQLFVITARTVKPGDELLFDYSTTIGDDDIWTMRCNCGSTRCRKRVRRFGSLPAATREDYIARGLVPKFILDTLL